MSEYLEKITAILGRIESEEEARSIQREAMEADPREWLIRTYLDMEVPGNWSQMTVEARATYFQTVLDQTDGGVSSDLGGEWVEKRRRSRVCLSEIINECLTSKTPGGLKMWDNEPRTVARIMGRMPEWERVSSTNIFQPYGRQKYYRRREV